MSRTQSIYLGWTSYRMEVSPEGYEKILQVVRETAICEKCAQHYTNENPNVAGLLCLSCFLEPRPGFTFLGMLDKEDKTHMATYQPYERVTWAFLDTQGYVYLTDAGPGASGDPRESIINTLKYWKFPRPEQVVLHGKTVDLRDDRWHIYGDLTANVILLRYSRSYENIDVVFIVSKQSGQFIQLSKRKEMHRRLLAEARAELEQTRQPDGRFLIDGEEAWQIWDSHVYAQVARRIEQEQKAITR